MVKNLFLIFMMLITQVFIPQSAAADTLKPVLSVNPDSIQFGNVYVRTSSAPVTVTVTNTGNADLIISSVTLVGTNPGEFAIVSIDLSSPVLAPGESISGQVQFNPTSAGSKIACIRIASNDPCNNPFYVVLRGTGVYDPSLQPEIEVSPASIDFGSVYINTDSTPATVTVTNTGTANLIITNYFISGTDFTQFTILSTNTTSDIIPPGTSVSGLIQFHPTSTGPKEASLHIFSNDADESQVDVPLTGYGTDVLPQPDIEVTPLSLDFGTIELGSTSVTQNVTVSNTGTANLNIDNLTIGDGQFAITSGNISGGLLIPGDSANISLAFTPAAAGDFSTNLVILSDDADDNLFSVALYGSCAEGIADITASPLWLIFPDVYVGSTSPTQDVMIINTGFGNLTINNLSITSQFTLASANISGQILPPGSWVTLSIVFSPTADLIQKGTLTIESSDVDEPSVIVELEGLGWIPPEPEPQMYVHPTYIDFGSVTVNNTTPAQKVTISNTGTADLHIDDLKIFNNKDFTLASANVSGQTVPPGTSVYVSLVFTPTIIGVETCKMAIVSFDPNTGVRFVTLQGIGTSAPEPRIDVTPESVNFGGVMVGQNGLENTVTVKNAGDADLQINQIELQGENLNEFIIVHKPVEYQKLEPGEIGFVIVNFRPTTAGTWKTLLRIDSNDPDKPNFIVNLTGMGTIPTNPEINVTPLSIDFGSIQEESSSAPVFVMVTNSGTGELILGTLTIVGANSGDFQIDIDNVSNRTLAAGQSGNVSVKFSPLTAGDKEAGLQIPSNDQDEGTVHVFLSGKATVKPQPDIEVTPMSITFYPIKTGQTSTAKLVKIKNTGAANLITGTLTIVGADAGEFNIYSTNASNQSIPPGGSAFVYVRFKPTSTGAKEAGLQIPSNDPDMAEQNIHVLLNGTGEGWPDAAMSPSVLDFGAIQIGSSSAPQTATVRNIGTANLYIGKVSILGKDNTHFKIVNDTASGKTLPPGGTATVSVRFSPNSPAGIRSAALVISTSSTIHYQVHTDLKGKTLSGPSPRAQINPHEINFGQVDIGSSSTPETVTVKNTGTANLIFGSTKLTGNDKTQFSIEDDHVTGQTIMPGDSATFKVRFNPTSTGAKSAYIKLTKNEPYAPFDYIYLSGNGDEVPKPQINIEPLEIDFGSITTGSNSDTEYVTITNNGTAELDLQQISIEGSDKDHFVILSDNASLQILEPGDSALVGLQFQPQSAGLKIAVLWIPSNDPLNNDATVILLGTGEGPNISVYPTDIDFGFVQINTNSGDETVLILNDGTEDLTISTITLAGADADQFEIVNDTASSQTLAPWESAEVTVIFKPTTTGLKEAIISIPSNDSDESTVEVSLRGTGTEGPAIPEIEVTPLSVDFSEVDVYTASATQNVKISNTGSGNLLVENITTDNDRFTMTSANLSGQTLNPGASTNISLVFIPLTDGAQTGNLSIFSDDTDESPTNVTLTGKGIIHGTDLSVTKTDSLDPVGPNDEFTYTITVKNNGPDDATGVYVYDYLPSGSTWQVITSSSPVEYISGSASTGTITPYTDEVYWDIGPLANGADATMNITVKVKPMIFMPASSMNNTAEVFGMEYDPIPENNKDTELTRIRSTDLIVTKTVSPDIVDEGEPFIWTVTVTNNGTEYATNVTVLDAFAYTMVDVLSINASTGTTGNTAPDWMSSLGIASSANSSYIYWYIGDLDAGASATMTLTASANLSALQPFINLWSLIGPAEPLYPVMNIVMVLSPNGDTDITNNYAAVTNHVRLPLPQADLAITKSDNPDPATPGGTITYTVNVTNNGPEDVSNVYALDMWPNEQMTLDTATQSAGTTEQVMPAWFSVFSSILDEKGYIFWDIGPLDSGASASLVMTTTINATMPIADNVTNMAVVFGPAVDATKENNSTIENTSLTEFTDLKITKTASLDSVVSGDSLTYTINVTNSGSVNATGVQVVDTIPDLVEFVSTNTLTGTAEYIAFSSSISGNVTWDIGDLASGSSATLDIMVKVRLLFMMSSDNITNTAVVTGNVTDPDPTNNSASVVTMIRSTDLAITKTTSAPEVAYGDNFTWTVTVTNNGPEYATNVTALDMCMPAFTQIHEVTPSTGTLSDTPPDWMKSVLNLSSVTEGITFWNIGDLDVGASAYLTITASGNYTTLSNFDEILDIYSLISSSNASLPMYNIAAVLSPLGDPDFKNNIAQVITRNNIDMPQADLVITKTDSPDPVLPGGDITYTLSVTNKGPEDVSKAYVLDLWLKMQMDLVSATPSAGNISQTLPPFMQNFSSQLASDENIDFFFWDIGPLASGATATLTTVTTVNTTAPLSAPVYNMAAVFGRFIETNPKDNTVIITTDIAYTDLAITKADDPDPVTTGDMLTYTINISNNGPFNADGVKVTDILSENVTYESAAASTGTVIELPGNVTWDVGNLAAGENATLTLSVIAPSNPGMIFNSANVSSNMADPTLLNNSVSENTTVVPPNTTDLEITKIDDPDPVAMGGNLTYTVTVTNNGPIDATGVNVTDILPAEVTYQSTNESTGTATHLAGIIDWIIGDMAVGQTANMTVTVITPAETTSNITNTATVFSLTTDPIPDNNYVSEDTLVVESDSADLAIIKTDDPDPVATGDDLTYTITVTNNGPANASAVSVMDNLPAGTEFKSFLPSTGTPVHNTGIVTWNISDLSAGGSATLTILVKAPATATAITNTATVSGETADPNPANNEATTTTYVYDVPLFTDLQIVKTASPEPVIAGNTLTYTITVTNAGPNTATGITVTDVLPATYVPGSAATPKGMMTINENNLTWHIDSLAAGESATALVSVTAPSSSGLITNTTTVTGYEFDLAPFDNTATAITTVLAGGIFPDITVTPDSYDFGAVPAGTSSAPASITVTNDGDSNLVLNTLSVNDSQFTMTNDSISGQILIPGESANVSITFSPSATGPQSANLTIPSNDPDESTITVSLSGAGLEMLIPDIHMTPASINFGTITISGQRSEIVTVSNTGNGVLSINGLTINSSQFSISSGNISGQTLGPGASAEIVLVFRPDIAGVQSATLTINSNDPDENPAAVQLTGTGSSSPGPGPGPGPSPSPTPTPTPTTTTANVSTPAAVRYFTVNFLGKVTREPASNDGRPEKRIAAVDPNGTHLLEIEAGTGAKDANRDTVTLIEIREAFSVPTLPLNTVLIGKAYQFIPSGTIFDRSIRLTLGYDVSELPANVISVGTAYYSTTIGWVYLDTETTSVAELGKLTAPVNHFTVFAVLAKVAAPAITPTPTPTPVIPEVAALPASFTISNLRIASSVSEAFGKVIYFRTTGKEATITVDVTNEGEKSGTYPVTLYLNGEALETKDITLGAGQVQAVSFTVITDKTGTYTVQIGELEGEFTNRLWINIWLWVGTIILLGLICWYIVYLVKKKKHVMVI